MNIFNCFESVLSNLMDTEFFIITCAAVSFLCVLHLVKGAMQW